MSTIVLKILAILQSVVYIFGTSNIYILEKSEQVPTGNIINHISKQSKTACILKCQRAKDCDNAYHREEEGRNGLGDCWFVQEGNASTFNVAKTEIEEHDTSVELYSFHKVNPCKYGKCLEQCGVRNYKCSCDVNNWRLQATNVCFGAKNDNFGQFQLSDGGKLSKLKLVHIGAGRVECNRNHAGSRWGCGSDPQILMVLITNVTNDIIAPNAVLNDAGRYYLPNFNGNSPYVVLDTIPLISSKQGQQMRIWYADDLVVPGAEGDNSGISCADVYAVFCD